MAPPPEVAEAAKSTRDALDEAWLDSWLTSCAGWRNAEPRLEEISGGWLPQAEQILPLPGAGDAEAPQRLKTALAGLLQDRLVKGEPLRLPSSGERPLLSIIVVLHGQAPLTLGCLLALVAQQDAPPYEVILVDNASPDETPQLLSLVEGAKLIRHQRNLYYLRGVNSALPAIRGEALLLLNNDALLHPAALARAFQTLREERNCGAVGGRLVHGDGRLQEAGSLVFGDGRTRGYGRRGHPLAPQYLFRRDTDYVSGAFLLTPTALFRATGGFHEGYRNGYFEDADYCLQLWSQGQRVVYEPGILALHLEGASGPTAGPDYRLLRENRAHFLSRHGGVLAGRPAAQEAGGGALRSGGRPPLLVVCEQLPMEGAALAADLSALAARRPVTLVPLAADETIGCRPAGLPLRLEVLPHLGAAGALHYVAQALAAGDAVLALDGGAVAALRPVRHWAAKMGWPGRLYLNPAALALLARRVLPR